MSSDVLEREPLRPVIGWAVAVCLAIAMAPWLSGGQEPIAVLISGFALLTGVVLLGRQPSVRQLKYGPLTLTYAALVAWSALSLIWSANRYSSVTWVIGLVLAGIAFRLAYAVAGEVGGRQRLIWVYLGSAAIFVVYGLYLYLTGGYDRLTGPFYWPNPAAAYLIPGIFIAYDQWRRGGHWINAAAAVLFGASFVLTDSRAAGAVLVLLAVIYIVVIRVNKRFWITFVFSVLAAYGLAYGLVWTRHEVQPKAVITTPGSRLAPAAAGNLQSGTDRVKYLESAANIWAAHPILGTGAGTFPDVHPKYQERVVSASSSAHDVYAQTFAELGIIGGFLLLWLLFLLGIGTIRGLWAEPLGLATALGAAGLWLHFGLDIDAQYPALVMLAAVTGGMLYRQRPRYRAVGWRLPLVAAVILVPITCLYLSDTWTTRGQAAQTDSDYDLAASDYAKAHSYLIYNPDVLTGEGINRYTLAQLGVKTEATTALKLAKSAERQDPSDGQHYQLEGFIDELNGDQGLAQSAFRQALKADPYNHPEYAYDLGLSLASSGHPDEALSVANAMLGQYPPSVLSNRSADPQIRSNLAQLAVLVGTIHLKANDLAGARAASKEATMFDSTNARSQALASILRAQAAK